MIREVEMAMSLEVHFTVVDCITVAEVQPSPLGSNPQLSRLRVVLSTLQKITIHYTSHIWRLIQQRLWSKVFGF